MSANFTIVIPTYNRPAHVERCIAFFEDSSAKCHIIIADGSRKEIADTLKTAVRRASSKIKIQHFSEPDSPMHWRIFEGMRKADTRYVAVQADDDFIFPNAASKACEVLDRNPEFIACQGPMLFVTHPISTPGHRNLYPHFPISGETALERVKSHVQYYSPTIFSVTRREPAIRAYAHDGDSAFPAIDELTATLLIAAQGKSCEIDEIYGIREQNPSQGGYHDSGWADILCHPTFSDRFSRMAQQVKDEIIKIDGLDRKTESSLALEVKKSAILSIRSWFNGYDTPAELVNRIRLRQDKLVHRRYDDFMASAEQDLDGVGQDMRAVLNLF
jgi:glycosyltransferase domain-containing protein